MHRHFRKIDFLISFHNFDSEIKIMRFHIFLGSEIVRGPTGRGTFEAKEPAVYCKEPRALRQEQGAGVGLCVLVLLREKGAADAQPGI